MKNIVLARVDDRLIHGEVVSVWTPSLNVNRIIIVDDEVSNDSFNKRVIKALAPNGVKCNVYSVEKGADITLGILAENDGRFPESAFSKGEFQKRDHRLSPELPEVRSFLRTVRGKNFCPGNRRMRILLYC